MFHDVLSLNLIVKLILLTGSTEIILKTSAQNTQPTEIYLRSRLFEMPANIGEFCAGIRYHYEANASDVDISVASMELKVDGILAFCERVWLTSNVPCKNCTTECSVTKNMNSHTKVRAIIFSPVSTYIQRIVPIPSVENAILFNKILILTITP